MPRDGGRIAARRVMYREITRVLAFATMLLGAVMIVVTARHGGGVGYLLGALFIAAGAGRLYLLGYGRRG